jgi:PAS domain S-box-containing protein
LHASLPSSLAAVAIALTAALVGLPFTAPEPSPPWISVAIVALLFLLIAAALLRFAQRCRRAESALRESERLRRSIIGSSPDHIMLLDRDGTILFINRTVPDLTPEQVTGTPVYTYVPESEHTVMRECFARVLETGEQDRYEVTYITQESEERVFESHVAPVLEAGRVVAMAVNSRDTTERRNMELERERLAAQLQQAQRLEALGRLAGGIAHDFNNLLTAILGNSELLLERTAGVATERAVREGIEQIHLAGERASLLTKRLLAFGRRQLTRPEVVDPRFTLAQLEPLLRRLIQEDVILDFVVATDVSPIRIDPSQLEQVVLNLVLNARDAMPDGGAITVECRDVELAAGAPVIPPGPKRRTYVAFSVRDEGTGIEPETAKHLFDPFFTTKPDGRGSGLGLATVYGIVLEAEGHIEIDSQPGAGATLRVFFPAADTPAPDAKVVVEPTGGRESILVCEDDDAVRRITCQILRSAGYAVIDAGDADEALRLGRDLSGVRLLVTDIVMPRMSGIELARRLREEREQLAVLFVSGYSNELLRARSGGALEVDLLVKPFQPKELLARVRQALDAAGSVRSGPLPHQARVDPGP